MGTTLRHYDNALCYLEKHYDYSFFSEDFGKEHFDSMVEHLKNIDETFTLEKSSTALTEALQDFFDSYHQNIQVTYNSDAFAIKYISPLKDIAHTLDKKDLHQLFIYLFELSENIDEYYHTKDLVIFEEEHFSNILSYFKDTPLDTAKKIIKCKICNIFNLTECDKVFFIHNKLAIRFNSNLNSTVKSERRYHGIPQKELEKLEDEYIDDKFEKRLLRELRKKFRTTLNFSYLTNKKFCNIYIQQFQDITALALKKAKTKLDNEFFIAFVNYILRKNFDRLLYLCAVQVLELIQKSAPNISSFISFYNGEVLFKNLDEKHLRPSIIDSDHKKWTFGTIRSFFMGLKNQEKEVKKTSLKKQETLFKIETLENEITSNKELIIKTNNKLDEVRTDLDALVSAMEEQKDSKENLYLKEDKLIIEKKSLQKELHLLEGNIENKEKQINNWQVVLKDTQEELEEKEKVYTAMLQTKEDLIIAVGKVINKKSIVVKESRKIA